MSEQQVADDTAGATLTIAPPESSKAQSRSLFAQRNFVVFWLGQTVSKVGNGAYQVALGWTVYQLTGSAAAMGLVLALNVLPQVVFALIGGTVADRLSRRMVIILSDSAAALGIGLLAVLSAAGLLSLPVLMAAAVLLGTISAFYGPVTLSERSGMIFGLPVRGGARPCRLWCRRTRITATRPRSFRTVYGCTSASPSASAKSRS
ncbi:MFS transporter [Streptomyces sp. NBC_01264]|uniref:MFS transporter n=1 Tax=Streptomyces sp. NBC_01264 TaxID=2903804 RepID=UPI0022539B6B|nr:MFS transporter [Streptomyces sp. NBC_01264]MCX4784184.1 MFS transporter [Streptomyces sp. NBC_01264]